jgi:hypothetical protein
MRSMSGIRSALGRPTENRGLLSYGMSDCQNGVSHNFVADCTAKRKVEIVGWHIFKASMVGMSLAVTAHGAN